MVLVHGFSQGCTQSIRWGYSYLKACWGLGESASMMVTHIVVGWMLNSHPLGLSIELLDCPYDMKLPSSAWSKRKPNCLLCPALVHHKDTHCQKWVAKFRPYSRRGKWNSATWTKCYWRICRHKEYVFCRHILKPLYPQCLDNPSRSFCHQPKYSAMWL